VKGSCKVTALLIFGILFQFAPGFVQAQERPRKKLLEFGWDVPFPDFVREHIKEMETRPFDGIIFRTRGFDHVFDTRPWKQSDLQPQMDDLSHIKWGRFTDNFLTLYAANRWNMNWFDDAQWKVISGNLKLFSSAVSAGKCVGVCFDNEPYANDPWVFTGRYPGKSYEEVAAQVRIRGAQFITALQTSLPRLKVLHFFQLGYYGDTSNETGTYRKAERWDLLNEPDVKLRTEKLSDRWLALFYPFFLGMLDAAGPGVIFIDGNEFSYYYDSPEDFYRNYHQIRQSALTMAPEKLRPKYINQVQAGMAIYFDILMSDSWGNSRSIFVPGNFMTPEERLRFLEHNLYYALTTADEYVWFYSEKMNWWENATPGPGSGSKGASGGAGVIPPGLVDAIVSARTKNELGKPLGYDISELIARSWEKARKAESELKEKK
jgi:hypothetical protein